MCRLFWQVHRYHTVIKPGSHTSYHPDINLLQVTMEKSKSVQFQTHPSNTYTDKQINHHPYKQKLLQIATRSASNFKYWISIVLVVDSVKTCGLDKLWFDAPSYPRIIDWRASQNWTLESYSRNAFARKVSNAAEVSKKYEKPGATQLKERSSPFWLMSETYYPLTTTAILVYNS